MAEVNDSDVIEIIGEILGKYVDPQDETSVKIHGNKIIVNTTQVAKSHLKELDKDLKGSGYLLVLVDSHPQVWLDQFDAGFLDKQ